MTESGELGVVRSFNANDLTMEVQAMVSGEEVNLPLKYGGATTTIRNSAVKLEHQVAQKKRGIILYAHSSLLVACEYKSVRVVVGQAWRVLECKYVVLGWSYSGGVLVVHLSFESEAGTYQQFVMKMNEFTLQAALCDGPQISLLHVLDRRHHFHESASKLEDQDEFLLLSPTKPIVPKKVRNQRPKQVPISPPAPVKTPKKPKVRKGGKDRSPEGSDDEAPILPRQRKPKIDKKVCVYCMCMWTWFLLSFPSVCMCVRPTVPVYMCVRVCRSAVCLLCVST